MAIKLQIRRGTASDWASASPSPTLLAGEIGYETDTGNIKVGNGSDNWGALSYLKVTYPQTTVSGTSIDAAGYRVQGRYEINSGISTGTLPSGWDLVNDTPAILLVTSIATTPVSVSQVLFSTKTQKVFCRAHDGTNYTTWVPLSQHDDSVNTSQIVNLAVTTGKIADDAVTFAKMQEIIGRSVMGKATAGTGNPAEITATNADSVLRHDGTSLSFGTVATAGLANASVTSAKLSAGFFVNRETFVSNATWTSPAHVTAVRVMLVGGGGGGGGHAGINAGGIGGDGAKILAVLKIQPNTTYSISVGAGGNGSNSGNGSAGSATTMFGMSAGGGAGGTANAGATDKGNTGTATLTPLVSGVTEVWSVTSTSHPLYQAYPWPAGGTRTTGISSGASFAITNQTTNPGAGGRGETGQTANDVVGGMGGLVEIEWIDHY